MRFVNLCDEFLCIQQVDAADPAFPRPTAHWWFGCKNSPSQFSGNIELEQAHENEDGDTFGNIDAG